MTNYEKHYVDFYSPGTLVSESSRKPIDSWDIRQACELANGIKERHNAKPYGFRFVTMLEAPDIPDGLGGTLKVTPKQLRQSPLHYLGGTVIRYCDVAEADDTSIRSNMRCNDMPVLVENRNSWRFTGEFKPEDSIVDADGSIVRRGSDPDLTEYREQALSEFKVYRDEIEEKYRTVKATA